MSEIPADSKCPNCGAECNNADSESYAGDMSYQNENYCNECHCSFRAIYKFSHIENDGVDDFD